MKSPTAFCIETKWTDAEKKIARKAFDRAFTRQSAVITEKVQRILDRTPSPRGVWEAHDYLTRQRWKVDRTYDYRYSVLISVFAALLRDGWLERADLEGLAPDKIDMVEEYAGVRPFKLRA